MAAVPRSDTRTLIVDQALRSFGERGYAATSLQEIASAAGCSKSTVLYHFADKHAVLLAAMGPCAHELEALVDGARVMPAGQAQARVITGFVDLMVRYRGLVGVVSELTRQAEGPTGDFGRLLNAGRELPRLLAGSTDSDSVALAVFAIHGALGLCRDADGAQPGCPDPADTDSLRNLLMTAVQRLLLARRTDP